MLRRGRPRTYGIKITPDAIRDLPLTETQLTRYGKEKLVRLRTVVAVARFLKGVPIRAVWCELYDADKHRWSETRLLLATETQLSAEEILQLYARRWDIDPLFHDLKRWWGVNNLWQQKRTVLELWVQIRSTAWTLVTIEPGCGTSFPYRDRGTVAQQTTLNRRSGSAMAAHGIYRPCFQR